MSLLYFLLLVGVLVAVHELGHFVAARALGIRVTRLSLGFGPALFKLQGRDTEYRLGVIPLGGYVRLLGEDPAEPVAEEERPRAFSDRPLRHRLIVVFAGPAANLIFPLVIYFFFYLGHSEVPAAAVGDVLPDSPAASVGLQPGDLVRAVDDGPVRTWEDFQAAIDRHVDQSVLLTYVRGGKEQSTYVTPRRVVMRERDGRTSEHGMIGVTRAPLPPKVGIIDEASAAARAGLETGDLVVSIDGHPVDSWTSLAARLPAYSRRLPLAYLRPRRQPFGFARVVTYDDAALAEIVPDFTTSDSGERTVASGITSAELFVARVDADSPAAHLGLVPGDRLTTLDGVPLSSWLRFDQALQAEPDREHDLGWLRRKPGGGVLVMTGKLHQQRRLVKDEFGHERAVLGLGVYNDFDGGGPRMIPVDGRFSYALGHALTQTGRTIRSVAGGFVQILSGQAPEDGVGGPLMMYRIASVSGQKGWDYFLLMLALISINLGLINLLPIPVLDGGHLVMFAIEGLSRRKLSPRLRDAVLLVGLIMIVSMTLLALRNDVLRYVLT